MKSIRQQVRASRVLSAGDFRLARRLGLIASPRPAAFGFNDDIIYPPEVLPAGAPTRAMAAALTQPHRAPPTGRMHALALLVDFSDNPGQRPAAEFQRLLFDASNPNSMTSFYRELSYRQFNVDGEVIGYVRAPRPYSFYTAGESGTGMNFPQNTPGLLIDALTEFCKTHNLARFDLDGDGYVDGIFLIHAGAGAEAEPDPAKRPHKIWSHKWVLPQPFVNNGVKVYAYSTEPEDGRLGVFAHEFGHSLGLPDLYDATYRSAGVGDWCLMGGGSWGGGGNQPVRMSVWCLSKLGWVKPKNLTKKSSLTLPPLDADKKAAYRMWTKGKASPEYFLLEHRQRAGRDQALPGQGLVLWHIDERQSDNTNPFAYRVAVVQADGRKDLERAANEGDGADAFPGTNNVTKVDDTTHPSTRDNLGNPTGTALSKIALAPGKVTLQVKV